MQDMRKMIMIIAAVAMLTACGSGQTGQVDPEADTTATVPVEKLALPLPEPGVVQTVGKVVAERYADLAFETALPIEQVLVRNGQKVRRGQVLATLDQFKLRNDITQKERAVEQAQLRIEQAHLQMQDVIIAHGFDPDNTAKVQLEAARHDLQSGVLTAPFDGVVANLSVQAHQLAEAGKTVCRVIATGDMLVEFRVMEADLRKYKVGTSVHIIPVADKSQQYEATVSEINPIVDQQGAVTLRARLAKTAELFDGMNVEVVLKSEK